MSPVHRLDRWSKAILLFKPLAVRKGKYRVEWEWLGEGQSGDYNENDENDVPLLRFSCERLVGREGRSLRWEAMDSASYCTNMSVAATQAVLRRVAEMILGVLDLSHYRRELERLTWLGDDDVEIVAENKPKRRNKCAKSR